MTKLYLIRHAEAEGNLYRIVQGQCNSTITDRGNRQIQALAARFQSIPIDAVYASDLYRTCATARAIYVPKHLPLHRRRDLREICVGDWEEKTWGEIARETPEQMLNFSQHPDRWHIPGAETPEQVRDRVLSALREIARENDGKTVAVFSHGYALRMVLGTLQGYTIAQIGQTPHGDNTAVSLVEAEGDRMKVIFRDDCTHLQNVTAAQRPFRGKRPTALEPGLCFARVRLPEQADWLACCVREAWADSADQRPMDRGLLLQEAAHRPTLAAELAETPVGLLQLNPAKGETRGQGWISLYCVEKAYRARGLGIQLLGQAVLHYRPLDRQTLCLALAEGNGGARRFFTEYGFAPTAERTADGREVWSKDIRFPAL